MSEIESEYKRSFHMWNDVYAKSKLVDLSKKELSVEPTFDIVLDLFAYYCKNVVDYGCGTGDILFQIRQFGALEHGLGIDMSEIGISYADKDAKISHYDNLTFLKGSLCYFKEIPDDNYDGIILSNVLDVMPPEVAQRTLNELTRVLQTGGYALIN